MNRKVGIFLLVLLAFGLFTAQRYRTSMVQYKYPYYRNFGAGTNDRVTFVGELKMHSWLRAGGTDTVKVWYFIGGDSTLYQIPPMASTLMLSMDRITIKAGDGGGIRLIKDTGTNIILSGARDVK